MKKIFVFVFAIAFISANAQKQSISVEDVWRDKTFMPAFFSGFNSMNDGVSYTDVDENGDLVKYELKTGNKMSVLVKASELTPEGRSEKIKIQDYTFSDDETKLVLKNDYKAIYRRSGTATNYVFDLKTRKLKALSDNGKQMFATLAPVGNKVAFVRDNDLFMKDLDNNTEKGITSDGENNKIKNGWADWVYEEEFSKAESFFWNSSGTKIAFIRYDESKVKEFEMALYNGLYPEQYKFKYPKAGEDNSIVSVHIYDLASKKITPVDIGKETNIYIPRIIWTNDPNILSVQRMNRLQNKLELLFADATTGTTKVILTEEAKTYIDITDDLTFLPNNKGFIWSSEQDGYNHLYHYDFTGKLVNQVTKGNWDIMEFKGYDEAAKTLYYVSTEVSPTDRDVYAVSLDGKTKKKLSTQKGTTDVDFSKSFKYYVSTYSNANTPFVFELHSSDGKLIKVLEDNKALKDKLAGYDIAKKEFFTFKTSEGVELNGWMMKPSNFDAAKKYPVFMFAYGGPGANECNNQWELYDYPWHQV
ncbi:MAG TPA: DPP IV N-terminal domain-containing protein, partial [Bacteroidia bacterium]|nr:DPP IV N-terminal domain-containing protein [Bacteroidia bacterium]